jgi:hypothetical protein
LATLVADFAGRVERAPVWRRAVSGNVTLML